MKPVFLVGLLVPALAGCAVLPFHTRANAPLPGDEPPPVTRARTTLSVDELPGGVFVGIAMSGGGSRAANFSAALLFELEELGVLPRQVSALSSVSGSSLTAAYYGVFAERRDKWNPAEVRKLLRSNFESMWLFRWFLPHNILRYWLTNFDRSDIMKGVFDDVLFENQRFGHMPPMGPRILLNATILGAAGDRFVFTDERFQDLLRSRLDTYPLAHAVMASGAFPGAFTSVTLEGHQPEEERRRQGRRYLHLYDGGATDNLGISTLQEDLIRPLYGARDPADHPKGCFLLVFDANAFDRTQPYRGERDGDPRGPIDFFVDLNVLDASGALVKRTRSETLADAGVREPGKAPFGSFPVMDDASDSAPAPRCATWVLTFERLWELGRAAAEPRASQLFDLAATVNAIQTRYLLTGPERKTPEDLQEALFSAAKALVWEDVETLSAVCRWFRQHETPLRGCPGE